jgi:hypothetical protein
VRVVGRPEDDLLLRHRRRLEPDQNDRGQLLELLDEVLQHLPLRDASGAPTTDRISAFLFGDHADEPGTRPAPVPYPLFFVIEDDLEF